MSYLWIFLGGGIGSMARFAASGLAARHYGETFPWGTLLVNVSGSLLIGFFADPEFFGLDFMAGIFHGGSAKLLGEQALANGAAIVWSFAMTYAIMQVLKRTIGIRVDAEAEATGLDLALHGETAYHGGSLH